MWTALQKALALLLLIGIGFLLQKKIQSKAQTDGLKALILNLALPATIFIALLKTEVRPELVLLPVLALVFNLFLLGAASVFLPWLGLSRDSPAYRTLLMMIPSLAPGLSCFPLIMEYMGEQPLAWAALADLGNKVFVLIFLYLLAMRWHYAKAVGIQQGKRGKIKDLLQALLREPVNLVILAAIILLSLGLQLRNLPDFAQEVVGKVGAMMTPLVLVFIGLSMRLSREEFGLIGRLLMVRAGLTLLISGVFIALMPGLSPEMALLAVVFPQSAASFWPFAHISAVHEMESTTVVKKQTFQPALALNFIALSLPASTLFILSLFTAGVQVVTEPAYLLAGGAILCILAIAPAFVGKAVRNRNQQVKIRSGLAGAPEKASAESIQQPVLKMNQVHDLSM